MGSQINSIQHVGLAVKDMDTCLAFYRKFFGMDVPFFDSVAAAPLMTVYTRNEVITKRASMILNLKGGCAMEIVSPTSFSPTDPAEKPRLGDFGIAITQIKTPSIEDSYEFCKENNAPGLSEILTRPNGELTFYLTDPEGNQFQYLESAEWYTNYNHHSGGVIGCTIAVPDMEDALKLYGDILGYSRVEYDQTGVFDDFSSSIHGGEDKFRRVLLTQPHEPRGGFCKVGGRTYIELVQAIDRQPHSLFKDRIWADPGFVHLGFDVRGMEDLGKELGEQGYGFTCDSKDVLDMGNTRVHCTYIEDRGGTWLEMIEVYKIPIVEKWGIYLNVEKRDPSKPLPDYLLKAMRFSRIKS